MLALKALGALDQTTVFPQNNISIEIIKANLHLEDDVLTYYPEMISALYENGNFDIAKVVDRKYRDYHIWKNKIKMRNKWLSPIKEFDEKHFKGVMRKIKRAFY
jgi:hypothetical protein